jgi:hypothetical protein
MHELPCIHTTVGKLKLVALSWTLHVDAVLAGAAGASLRRRHHPQLRLQRRPPGLVGFRVRQRRGRRVGVGEQVRRGAEPDAAVPERQPEGVPSERHALRSLR